MSDLEIKIKTEADTSGLDRAKQSLTGVEDATRKLQQAEDVAEAKRRVNARSLTAASGQLKNLGSVANQVGFQVTDFAVQVQGGQSAITALSQQLPQAIGALQQLGGGAGGVAGALSSAISGGTAFSLIATGLAIGGKLAADAYFAMSDAVNASDNAVENFKNTLIPAEERLRNIKAIMRQEGAAARFLEDAEAAKLLNAELAHTNELTQARDSLAATQARIGGAGANQTAVQGVQQLAGQFERDQAAAIARKDAAQNAFANQQLVVQAIPDGSSAAELEAAQAKLKELEDNVATTTRAVVKLGEINAIKLEEAGVEATDEVTKAAEAAFTKSAETLKTQLEQIQAKEGAATSAAVIASLKQVNQMLADGKVTGEEVGKLGGALQLFRQSMEAGTQETQRQLNDLIALTQNQAAALASSRSAIDTLINSVGKLQLQSAP